jgi:hypothetical protein
MQRHLLLWLKLSLMHLNIFLLLLFHLFLFWLLYLQRLRHMFMMIMSVFSLNMGISLLLSPSTGSG